MGASLDIALGRRSRNKIVNPASITDQRNAGAKVIAALAANVYYGADRRCVTASQAGKVSIQRHAVALGARQPTTYSTKVAVEATAVVAAADYNVLHLQTLEGLRMCDMLWGSSFARPAAYTIMAQVPVAGIYSLAVKNGDSTRSYVTTIQFNQANVLETHTVLVPGDTVGTWPVDASRSAYLTMSLGSGANYTTANLNQWQSGNFFHAAGAVNLMGTAGNTVYVAFDQFERDQPTDLEIITDPDIVEMQCKRYFEKLPYAPFWLGGLSPGYVYGPDIAYSVAKRDVPSSITLPASANQGYTSAGANVTPTYWGTTSNSIRGFSIRAEGCSGYIAGTASSTAELLV